MGEHGRNYDYAQPPPGSPGGQGGQQDPGGPGFQYGGELAQRDRGLSREQIEAGMRQAYGPNGDQPSGGGHSGGHYTISLGQLRYAITQVDAMIDAATHDRTDAEKIVRAESPAQDAESSVMFTKALRERGRQILDLVNENIHDLKAYKDHLEAVERDYAKQEADTMVTFRDLNRDA